MDDGTREEVVACRMRDRVPAHESDAPYTY